MYRVYLPSLLVVAALALAVRCGGEEEAVPTAPTPTPPLPTATATPTPAPTLAADNYRLVPVLSELPAAPVDLDPYGDNLVVGYQTGEVWVYGAQPRLLTTLTVSTRPENGLLAVRATGTGVYVYYSSDDPACGGRCARLDELTWDGRGRRTLLEVRLQPQWQNHAGGGLAYRDGYLYVGIGDGSDYADGANTGQDQSDLLGSIVRVDPVTGEATLYATGFRNPWRMAFDRGSLWVGDVGQNRVEEINVVVPGGNYGWSVQEGGECFNAADPNVPLATCAQYLPPFYTYPHGAQGCAIMGGLVYRGLALPELAGRYVYGDMCTGEVLAIDSERQPVRLLTLDEGGPMAFAVGPDGDLLIADHQRRAVYRVRRS